MAVLGAAARLAGELGQPVAGYLRAVGAARELADVADAALQAAVDLARGSGSSWKEIGDALHTTRQAAFQRFGRPVDPRTGEPMISVVLPEAGQRATEIFADLAEGLWHDAIRDFGELLRGRLDASQLARGWAHTASQVGAFERMGVPSARSSGNRTIVDVPLQFEAGDALGRVIFDCDGAVLGLSIRPASEPATPAPSGAGKDIP